MFLHVYVQEAFDVTVLALAAVMNISVSASDFKKMRSGPKGINKASQKSVLAKELQANNSSLRKEMEEAHSLDMKVYETAKSLFCEKVKKMVEEKGEKFWRKDLVEGAENQYRKVCDIS